MRQAIRKAERNGVTTRISSSRQALTEFYRLHGLTRKRHGLPPQPLAFFLNLHEEILKRGRGFLVTAFQDSRAIAANLYVRTGTRAIYKFGASDSTFQHLRPSNLVMWRAIEFLANSGVKNLHFGRTSIGSEGLRRFKRSWGATEEPLAYHQFETATQSWVRSADRVSGIHTQIFSRLPAALNRLAGALIYPHLD
jgi:lipid II:glycine glycyltransferase (peptidoglycan interpeptide bridge formation enzyme)